MATETIREFLAGLGFKVDDASERRFVSALEGATLRAKLLGDAIEATARSVVDSVGKIAEQFEQLFYQSKQFGGSAASIKAFEYAVSQLGGTVEGARSSLVNFGRWIKETPGSLEFLARQFKIQTKNIDGSARDVAAIWLDINERLSHMPRFLQKQWRETFGVDERTQLALNNSAEAAKRYADALKALGGAGVNQGATEAAVKFEKTWRDVWMKIGAMADGGYSKLLSALTDPMQKFGDWLDRNSPKLNDAIGKMANAVGDLTMAWVDDLNKVDWPKTATDIDNTTKSIAGFVVEIRDLVKWLNDFNEASKSWWIIKFLNRTAGGTEVKPLPSGSGFGASHGPGVGGGLWQWLKDNWGLKQNGAPVSESNPLAVNVVKVPDGTPGGGGFFSNLFGGIKNLLGLGGGAPPGIRRRGGGPYNYEDSPNAGELTKLITAEAKRAGIDPRLMEGIRAGESLHTSRYDVKDDAMESSWGPFQLNRRSGLGVQFERDTGLDLRDPKTIPAQARWVAEYIKRTGDLSPWHGYHGPRTADPNWGDSGYIPPKAPIPKIPPVSWDTGPAMQMLNAHLPVGPSSVDNSSRHVSSNVTNNITVNSPDPQSAASMVGVHLDRTANDISRNLQGAFQ